MQSNSGGLKRTRSPKNQDRVPLPPIDGERMLQVYTHKSLRMPGAREGEDTDNERLSALGERVLEMAVLDALMGERPALSVDVLETRTKDIVDGDVVERWAEQYNMPTKLRCVPAMRDSLSSREEVRAIFHAYVGALFIEQGISSVKQWMEALLGMESHRKIKPLPAMPRSNTQIPQPNASFTQKPFMRSHAPTPSPAFLTSPPMSPIHHMSVSPTPSSASSSSSSTMSTTSSTTWRSQTPGFQTPSFSQTPNPMQYPPPRPRQLKSLKMVVESVAWNKAALLSATNRTSTREMLVGWEHVRSAQRRTREPFSYHLLTVATTLSSPLPENMTALLYFSCRSAQKSAVHWFESNYLASPYSAMYGLNSILLASPDAYS